MFPKLEKNSFTHSVKTTVNIAKTSILGLLFIGVSSFAGTTLSSSTNIKNNSAVEVQKLIEMQKDNSFVLKHSTSENLLASHYSHRSHSSHSSHYSHSSHSSHYSSYYPTYDN